MLLRFTYLACEEDGGIVVLVVVVVEAVVLVLPLAEVLEGGGSVPVDLQPLLLLAQDHHLHHGQPHVVLQAGVRVQPGGDGGQGEQVVLQPLAVLARHRGVGHQQQLHLPGPGDGAAPPPPPAAPRRPLDRHRVAGPAAVAGGQRLEAEAVPAEEVGDAGRALPVDAGRLPAAPRRLHGVAGAPHGEVAVEAAAEVEDGEGAGAAVHRAAVGTASRGPVPSPQRLVALQVEEEAAAAGVEDVARPAAPRVGRVEALHDAVGPAGRPRGRAATGRGRRRRRPGSGGRCRRLGRGEVQLGGQQQGEQPPQHAWLGGGGASSGGDNRNGGRRRERGRGRGEREKRRVVPPERESSVGGRGKDVNKSRSRVNFVFLCREEPGAHGRRERGENPKSLLLGRQRGGWGERKRRRGGSEPASGEV